MSLLRVKFVNTFWFRLLRIDPLIIQQQRSFMNRISKQQLIRAALGGLQLAERKFSKQTCHNLAFARAPEYLLTTYIAEQLHKAAPNHMTWFEFHLAQARLAARGHDVMNPEDHRKRGGRCDILMCWASSREPRAAFEVKRDVRSLSTIKADTTRIIDLLDGGVEGNTLQFGAVMFSTMAECVHGQKIIRDRIALFRKSLLDWQNTEGHHNLRLNIISGGIKKRRAGDFWAPLALIAERA